MTRARVSIVGFEQRKDSPLSVLRKRKPPAAALAVPALATSGRTTRAVFLDVLVMTDPGETPTREIPAELHAGRMPGPVVKVNDPCAGTSSAMAGTGETRARSVAARTHEDRATRDLRRIVGTPSAGKQVAPG